MEEIYDLSRYTHCLLICISRVDVYFEFFPFSQIKSNSISRESKILESMLREFRDARITYNKQKTKVISWGDAVIEKNHDEDNIEINDFKNRLYRLFKKEDEDEFIKKAVSDYLNLAVEDLCISIGLKNFDLIHYTFIVPSEWEEEIREDLIRPIFVQANLINKEDHKDRLLFISDIESICQDNYVVLRRGVNTIMCRIVPIEPHKALIKLDLIKTANTWFNIPGSELRPKVVRSESFYITSDDIKNCIKTYLIEKVFPKNKNDDQATNIEKKVAEIFKFNYRFRPYYDTKSPIDYNILKSLYHYMLDKSFKSVKKLIFDQLVKEHNLIAVIDEYSTNIYLDLELECRLRNMWNLEIENLGSITTMSKHNNHSGYRIDSDFILTRARSLVDETFRNSSIYSAPRIITADNQIAAPSIFLKSKADIIITIDISLKFTLLSCTIYDDNGLIVDTFEHNCFMTESLPSLDQFYHISDSVALKVKNQFILFADQCLLNELSISQIIEILSKDLPDEALSVTRKNKHINAFFFMYFGFIKKIISSQLPKILGSKNLMKKIGYGVVVEKVVLDFIIGSRKKLEELIYKSGLISKEDEHRKLRIITKEEGILSAIQQLFVSRFPALSFPVKSYFALAQMHENYIQLTLNQVVTASSVKETEQEAIIIEDEIIFIQNVYDSLCLSMWNKLIENNRLIQSCDIHRECSGKNETPMLFSLKTRKEFMHNFKQHILNNILAENSELLADFHNPKYLKFCDSCNCQVRLNLNDIVEISFKPLLKDLSCIMLAALINKELLGPYKDIKYYFNFIHFNHSIQFRKILETIMNSEAESFNPDQGIDSSCIMMPELSNKLSQITLNFLYKGFKEGTLYQIYDRSYELIADDFDEIGCTVLKKGDRVNDVNINKLILISPSDFKFEYYFILYEAKTHQSRNFLKKIGNQNPFSTYNYNFKDRPFIFTSEYLRYSPTTQFLLKVIDDYDAMGNLYVDDVYEVTLPLTLCRY